MDDHLLTSSTQHVYDLLKLNYEDDTIQQHQEFIENIVDIIAAKVGELYPVYRTLPKITHGSFYQRTKIEQPIEFDFLHPFEFSKNKGIRIENKSKFPTSSPNATEVYVSQLVRTLLTKPREDGDLLHNTDKTAHKRINPISDILEPLHRAISEALIELDSDPKCHIVYRGECDLKRSKREFLDVGETDPYALALNEVAIDCNDFGPCMTLAIGGPLCITNVDMTFCIEDLTTDEERKEHERYFVLPRYGFLQENWLRTSYKPGNIELDEHHTKILLVLKYCFAECKKYHYDATYSSHILRTLVLHHHQDCHNQNSLGRCFFQIVQHVFKMTAVNVDTEVFHISPEWLESLKNVSYPIGVAIINAGSNLFPTDILFTLSLYILVLYMGYRDSSISLCGKDFLSVVLQIICKYSTAALNIEVGGLLNTEVKTYNRYIFKDRVKKFINELTLLRYKGNGINSILSHAPLPYLPYCPDPEFPIRLSPSGQVQKICKENEKTEWENMRDVIEINIGLKRFLELRKNQKNKRHWEQVRRQEVVSRNGQNVSRVDDTKRQEDLAHQEEALQREDMRRWVFKHQEKIKCRDGIKRQEEVKRQEAIKHQEEIKRKAEIKYQDVIKRQMEIRRKETIERQEKAIKLQDEAIKRQDEAIKRQDEAVKRQEEAIRRQDEAIERQDKMIKYQAEITLREETIKRQEEIRRQGEKIKRQEEEIKRQEEEIKRQEEEIKRHEEIRRKAEIRRQMEIGIQKVIKQQEQIKRQWVTKQQMEINRQEAIKRQDELQHKVKLQEDIKHHRASYSSVVQSNIPTHRQTSISLRENNTHDEFDRQSKPRDTHLAQAEPSILDLEWNLELLELSVNGV